MAYAAHSRESNSSTFYPRAPVSNSRHASPEAELEDSHLPHDKPNSGSVSLDGNGASSSGEGSGGTHSNNIVHGSGVQTAGYDGISPFFGSSGLATNVGKRLSSPYGTPTAGTPTSSSSFFPAALAASNLGQQQQQHQSGSRSPYPTYLQQQGLHSRSHPTQYFQHQQGYLPHSLHNPVISPSYLQQSSTAIASSSMQQLPISTYDQSNPLLHASGYSNPQNNGELSMASANNTLLDEIDDEDEDEEDAEQDDNDDDSSAEDHSSYGDDVAVPEVSTTSQGRKRGRPGSSTAKSKLNGLSTAKRVKQEGKIDASNSKSKSKVKAKFEVAQTAGDLDSKSKSTRGSKACTVCRRLKMRCEPAPDGDESKCKRCRAGGHECIFEESQRGRRKNQKTDAMAKSIKNMENTLETVLKAIAAGNAHTVVGMSLGSDGNLVPGPVSQLNPDQPPTFSPNSITTPLINLPPLPPVDLNHVTQYAISNPPVHNAENNGRQEYVTGDTNARPAHSGQSIFAVKTEDGIRSGENPSGSPALRLHSLPEPENTWAPLGLLAEASLENNQSKRRRSTFTASNLPHNLSALEEIQQARAAVERDDKAAEPTSKLGVANDAYFQPGPFNILPLRHLMIDKNLPSPLLTEKIITVDEAVALFNLYHRECSMFTAHYLLEDWHTPMNVSSRSTFLFTTICAVASKFYEPRPELYGLCMPYARKLASDMIERGFKSVEIVQAYMLLAYYNTPTERFEDDRTWTYIGLAIRMAVELNLWRNPKQPPDLDEEGLASFAMETANRERTWYQIFIMDRSIAIQTGRPHSLRVGHFERNVKAWSQQPGARLPDVGLAAIVELYRITSGFQDLLQLSCFERPDSANLNDYAIVTRSVDNALENWNTEWDTGVTDRQPSRQLDFTSAMKAFYYHYHRLLAYSFALQHMLRVSSSSLDILPYFLPAYESATRVLQAARDKLHASGHLKYAPDLIFINISYAAVFLLKLLRPELAEFTDAERILGQVEQMVATMEECSVDAGHTPALYAGFLRLLVAAKRGKDGDGQNGIKLDPALASKLSGDQQQYHSGLSATLAVSVPSGNEVNTQASANAPPAIFAQDVSGMSSRPNGFANINASAFMAGEPSNQAAGAFWNLDQLGQAGFWENLSMPGLGSPPTYGLSAGHLFQGDPWPFSTPNSATASRNNSPKLSAASMASNTLPTIPHLQ